MTKEEPKDEEEQVNEPEPICLYITTATAEELNEESIKDAASECLYNFKFCRTLNPFVWFFLGTWKPEISGYEEDRINRLVDDLKSVEGVTLVTVSYVWTNFLRYQQLAWKAWREIIS